MKKQLLAAVSIFVLTAFTIVALAAGIEVNEKIEVKKGEKIGRNGQIESAQKFFVYAVQLEKGQTVNLAAVFRGNLEEQKPNSVFRDNVAPSVEVRRIYKADGGDAPVVGRAKDGKWSGAVKESGDYLIVVSRPAAKGGGDSEGEQAIYPYRLLVWTN